MILRRGYVAADIVTSTTTTSISQDELSPRPSSTSFGSPYTPENWSSLIGIITAIVGNVLISFALNMQRYAHIRLEREWRQKERGRRLLKRRSASDGVGTVGYSEESLGDTSSKFHRPRHADYRDEDGGTAPMEDQPLLSAPNQTRSQSGLSFGSSNAEEAQEAYKQKSYLRSPWWWAGIILMTVGEAGNFLAYGFAPASIVSPLGVVALISNCIIAPFMLKESFRARDGFGVLVAVGGAVTVVLSASDNNPKLGPEDIWGLITTWEFETYLGITIAVIIALMVASNRFGEKSILIDLGLVGLFGGYTALSTKGVASMLSYTLWRAITFPVTYLLVAILAFTAVMQIKYINRALQRFDATQVIPVQFVLFTLSVILGSAVLYRDFERTSSADAGKFVGGCALTFTGVWLITSGRPRRGDKEDEDREPEDEDAINLIHGTERYHDEPAQPTPQQNGTPNAQDPSTIPNLSPAIALDGKPASSTSTPSPSHDTTINPWASHPPLLHHTTSSPTLLTQNPAPSLSDPNLARPHTPIRGTSNPETIPTTPSTSLAPLTPHRSARRDLADRLSTSVRATGPLLASPLSSTLNAMVADLKRAGGSVRGAPPASVLFAGLSQRQQEPGRRASEFNSGVGVEVDEEFEPLNRSRSLSGTLGDLWRGVRGVGNEGERG
ncbi:DUF803-domain-containing protein [Sporormia fimetaria CBS 119925]|uniref:DUF803-domain-containing protein n=1 Tax=Sporormia fimetaria CBS 119925 TaxID=1340428 RepID=A0A6A6VIA5_9PLEO|nr:DUF803-domain-containing protein [Sporormia fimetaria CBS 119925]